MVERRHTPRLSSASDKTLSYPSIGDNDWGGSEIWPSQRRASVHAAYACNRAQLSHAADRGDRWRADRDPPRSHERWIGWQWGPTANHRTSVRSHAANPQNRSVGRVGRWP